MYFFKSHKLKIILILSLFVNLNCSPKIKYDFKGINTIAKTYEVEFFQNRSDQTPGSIFHPGLDRDFTQTLQNSISDTSKLTLKKEGGELLYQGEIIEYSVVPMTAAADQTSSQNRLTISVNVRFFNRVKDDKSFERRFSFFFDFDAQSSLTSVQTQAHKVIFERIAQDIINASFDNW